MKKLIALLLALTTLLTLCACGGAPAEKTTASAPAKTPAPTPKPTPVPTAEPTPKPTAEPEPESSSGIRPELKEALDSYEEFMDEYAEFMNAYMQNPSDLNLLMKYADFLVKYEEMVSRIDGMDQSDMNSEELAYYIDVTVRVTKKLLTVVG